MMGDAHVAIVLAAGGSTRLGQAKQLLTRDGETLVHRVARLAMQSGARRTLVVLGADHARIAAAVADLQCEVIVNAAWQRGLGSSVAAAGAHLDGHAGPVLISVCDQPALDGHHLDALLRAARSASSGVAATRHHGALGVPALVPSAWLQAAPGAAELAHDRGFAARIARLPRDAVSVLDDAVLLHDVDTPDDLRHAIARGWLDAAGL